MLPIVALSATRELWAPDEPRYAQIAREIFDGGNPVVMHLNGALYAEKPPLLFWLAGVCGALFRWSELAMRVPSLCATIASALLTARMARRFFGESAAAWAAAFYLGCAMTQEIGGRLQIDPLLSCLCLAALDRFLRAGEDAAHEVRHMLFGGTCLGLAALAKGPPAWIHVALPLAVWRFFPSDARVSVARSARSWIVFALSAVIPVAVWAAVAATFEPALWKPYFYGQHIGRVADGAQHAGPVWYHVAHLPYLMLPWTFLFLSGLALAWRAMRGRIEPEWRALAPGLVRAASWFLVVLVFFSIITPKRDLYLLPIYPAMAIVCAGAWVRALGERRLAGWIGWGSAAALFFPGVLLTVAIPIANSVGFIDSLRGDPTSGWMERDEFAQLLRRTAWVGVPLIAGPWIAIHAWRRSALRVWACALFASLATAGLLLALLVAPRLNDAKSARRLAEFVASLPEKPLAIPCIGVQPEGYRFYGEIPTERGDLATALAREGAQFLGLISRKHFDRLDASERVKYRVLSQQSVGSRSVVVLGAAPSTIGG